MHRVEKPKPKPKTAKSLGKSRFLEDDPTLRKSTDQIKILPEKPILYMFKEITEATIQFTNGRLGKSSVYKSNLRGKIVAITTRKLQAIGDFRSGLGRICNIHHFNLIKLLGGCCNGGRVILVYDYVQGSSLADCLRNSRMPGYTVLNTWISRMQIAIDVGKALEYMHHDTRLHYVHNYLKSSSIIITEPGYRAMMCHVGACYLTGEYEFEDNKKICDVSKDKSISAEITEEQGPNPCHQGRKMSKRAKSMRITGIMGYMSPEYVSSGIVSQKDDVFAFGVILLELLAGREPIKHMSNAKNELERVSLIETVNRILLSDEQAECIRRLRSWVDPRLKDSFPVECAERVVRLAAACVDSEPERRPDMRYVAWKISKEFIISKQWSDKLRYNKEFITTTLKAR
ncbi:lysM domain receptor-like kinase 3 [Cryptomeria japonica]|uniref:lysM domain receptor-like kinase 3 n=1 Tax=Cryptomeria japonica TaxID=3369 RepID=UPI0027D9FDA1|nr:lysM domain receptor-like kinase 3 [Cryptomeria japonica]